MAEGKPVTVEAIVEAMNLAGITVEVLNPMMRSLALQLSNGRLAIESERACG